MQYGGAVDQGQLVGKKLGGEAFQVGAEIGIREVVRTMQLNTRICEAIENGDLKTFSKLVGNDDRLRNGPNAFRSWLHVASSEGQLPIVKYLVENGADVNLHGDEETGRGPIEKAAAYGHLHVMEYLLSHGAKLDVTRPERNPLFTAVYHGQVKVAKFLLEKGIDAKVVYRSVTGKLRNALSFAQERGEKEIGDLLTKAGCRLPMEGVDKPVWGPAEKIQKPTAEVETHQKIVAHLTKVLGPVDPLALQEIVPIHDEVHVSINVVRPTKAHPCLALFTTGMSDRALTVPKGQKDYQYVELVMYLPPTWRHPRDKGAGEDVLWPVEWLRQVAYYPHLHDTWLGGKMTIIASDEPPQPLGPNTKQTCLLLIADLHKWSPLSIGKKSVRFYTVIPIYTEERDFEKQHGIAPLLQRLQENASRPANRTPPGPSGARGRAGAGGFRVPARGCVMARPRRRGGPLASGRAAAPPIAPAAESAGA